VPRGVTQKLTGGDRRSIGRSDEVVADVLREPALFGEVFRAMLSDDPLIRMRAADATEKITARHPEYLQPYKDALLQRVAAIEQQEVRWHVAQMVTRLRLTVEERAHVVKTLFRYLGDESKIVVTFSLQALADFAMEDDALRPRVIAALEEGLRTGSPAVRSRARKLLEKLRRG